jgi:hypothetical protein
MAAEGGNGQLYLGCNQDTMAVKRGEVAVSNLSLLRIRPQRYVIVSSTTEENVQISPEATKHLLPGT